MNPEFEKKVNDSLETATYNPNIVIQPSPQQKINKNFNKKLILIFAFALICFATLIIVRAIFLQFPPNFDNNSIIGQILNSNGATTLDELNISEAQSIINDFSNGLTKEYQDFPSADSRILLLKSDNLSTIGKFTRDGSFNKITEIQNLVNIHRFYNEQTYLYSINTPNINLSELYIATAGNKPILIKRLEKNQRFIDAHFSLLDKTFYYSYFDENNTIYIGATDLKGTDYSIYKTNFLSTNTKIWSVDTSLGYIYLNQNQECFSLQLRDKILDAYACEKITSNSGNNFYWSNQTYTGLYTSFQKGEIYKFTFGEQKRKILTSKDNGQVIEKLSLSGDNLYYILNSLKQSGPTLWNIQPVDIKYINTVTTDEGSLDLKNMRSDIHTIIPFDSLYIISEKFFGKSNLYKYNPNPDIPTSYPDSYPASYAETVDNTDYYWEKPDLGVNYNTIEVIQPQYTYDF